jgi:ribosomal protein S3AE
MLRTFVCAVVAAALLAGPSLAQDTPKKKKVAGTSGQITAVDADKGTVTVEVKVKKNQAEKKTFKVTDKTTVTAVEGKTKTELTAAKVADLLKKEQFKVGAPVTIDAGDGDTAKAIVFVAKKKGAPGTTGQISAIDAAKGTVTVKVAVKKNTEEKTFKVTDQTKVTAVEGKVKTDVTADKVADLLKKEQFKVGATVSIQAGEGDTARAITFVTKKKKNQ